MDNRLEIRSLYLICVPTSQHQNQITPFIGHVPVYTSVAGPSW